MTRQRILVIEDDVDIARVVRAYLEHEGYSVDLAHDGLDGLQKALVDPPGLIVLDWMLPGLDGIELLGRLRGSLATPVIMLSARGEHEDRIEGFRSGVDDYVPKPFHPPELVARVQAVLRRSGIEQDDETVQAGDLCLDLQKQKAVVAGQNIPLTPLEFELLRILALHPGRVFRRNELLDRVWGRDFVGVDRVVDVHIFKLRQKLEGGNGRSLIETVRGVGYRFSEETL
ncbi:MAG: response regulator transcription factor [Trueperaceae bacterium]